MKVRITCFSCLTSHCSVQYEMTMNMNNISIRSRNELTETSEF